jgi:hypothetical protein
VESGNSICAIRFEPGITHFDPPTIQRIIHANKCSMPTAREIYASSFGKFQFLGMTLYSTLAYTQPIQVFFANESEQEAVFDKFMQIQKFTEDGAAILSNPQVRERFAKFYNGPGNIADYSERIVEAGALLMKASA